VFASMKMGPIRSALVLLLCLSPSLAVNSTASWLAKRDALIDDVFGYGPGVLTNKSKPDKIIAYEDGLQGLVWDMSTRFNITSEVFYKPVTPGKRSKSAFFFHHGHTNCVCPVKTGEPPVMKALCRPGCVSSMPTNQETHMPGYSWWDLYNVSPAPVLPSGVARVQYSSPVYCSRMSFPMRNSPSRTCTRAHRSQTLFTLWGTTSSSSACH
jgi:hypothetical protein